MFLEQVNQLLDWRRREGVIDNYAMPGRGIAGNRAYPRLLLFKMSLVAIQNQLSDRVLGERVNDLDHAAIHTQHAFEAICCNLKRAPQLYLKLLAAQPMV